MSHTPAEGDRIYGVWLPPSVTAIIEAAGGHDPTRGGMPYAMASIVGALPWIAVEMFKALPPAEYAEFANQMKANMQQAWQIAGSDNPPAAFEAALERAKRSIS